MHTICCLQSICENEVVVVVGVVGGVGVGHLWKSEGWVKKRQNVLWDDTPQSVYTGRAL